MPQRFSFLTTAVTALFMAGFMAAALFMAPNAIAKSKGDLVMRLRAVHFAPEASGTTSAGGSADVNTDNIPELDFTYFFTDNIAAELILATTRHDVNVVGVADLGEVSLIPPILTLQYHFQPKRKFSPYIGAGINYTIFYDKDRSSTITAVDYEDGFGWALQAGLDYAINERWSFNVDVKKVLLKTDITVNNGGITAPDVDLDPWVFSIGFGYRF